MKTKHRWILAAVATAAIVVLAACTAVLTTPTAPEEAPAASADATPTSPAEVADTATEPAAAADGAAILPPATPPFSTRNWSTDFTQRTVEWEEILSGGPPKDGIPAIDDPQFEDVAQAAEWLSERDPVIVFSHNDEVRGYPLAILIWHEIVNDEVGGKPVSVTFCPLCNASIVFDRELDGQILDFGTTGKLRNSDLIMYDRQTESWWQQFTGESIVGELTGEQLTFLASQVLSFADFAAEFPDAAVLARPPAARSYGTNPYVGYDSTVGRPFLYDGELDERLDATARVVGVDLDGTTVAYPFETVADAGAINDEIADTALVVFHKPGTASALDTRAIAEGEDIGSVGVFDRQVGDRTLTFSANGDGTFADAETGSTWTILGEAVDGELAGETLTRLLSFDHFWFAWNAFFPESELYTAE